MAARVRERREKGVDRGKKIKSERKERKISERRGLGRRVRREDDYKEGKRLG